jgi:hypothetical protein
VLHVAVIGNALFFQHTAGYAGPEFEFREHKGESPITQSLLYYIIPSCVAMEPSDNCTCAGMSWRSIALGTRYRSLSVRYLLNLQQRDGAVYHPFILAHKPLIVGEVLLDLQGALNPCFRCY